MMSKSTILWAAAGMLFYGIILASSNAVAMITNFYFANNAIIEWAHEQDHYYGVYWKDDIKSAAGWIPLSVNLPGSDGVFTDVVHSAELQGFYKLSVGTDAITSTNKVLTGISIDDYGREILDLAHFAYTCRAYYSDGTSEVVAPFWYTDSTNMQIDSSSGTHHTLGFPYDYNATTFAEFDGFTATHKVTVLGRPIVTELRILGPSWVEAGSDTLYECLAFYSDGTSNTASNVLWSDNAPSIGFGPTLEVPSYTDYSSVNIVATVNDSNHSCSDWDHPVSTNRSIVIRHGFKNISIVGDGLVEENTTNQYICNGYHTKWGYIEVSPLWSVESDYAAIDPTNGTLTINDVPNDQQVLITAEMYSYLYETNLTADLLITVIDTDPPSTPEGVVLIPSGTNFVNDGIYSNYVLTITNAFYMDECEVSGSLWSAVYDWALTNGYDFSTNGVWTAPDHPVVWINWYDCAKWCNARSQREGRDPCYFVSGSLFMTGQVANIETDYEANGFRMPTHEEWEYAARGGVGTNVYPWGNTITTNDANYSVWDTTSCGSYPTNYFGLYDIVGNVWEWCNNITVTNAAGISEKRGRASGGFDGPSGTWMKCGIHRDFPAHGDTHGAWESLGFRSICR